MKIAKPLSLTEVFCVIADPRVNGAAATNWRTYWFYRPVPYCGERTTS
jgi:hypothetical protein